VQVGGALNDAVERRDHGKRSALAASCHWRRQQVSSPTPQKELRKARVHLIRAITSDRAAWKAFARATRILSFV
jgi:hypothetical protein